jgi:hypothetical protein
VRLEIAVAAALIAEIGAAAGTIHLSSALVVKICIENGGASPWIVLQGEFVAAKIFEIIGIKIEWPHREKCPGPAPGLIAIRITTGASAADHPDALAYSRLGENRIEVFYDRVAAMVDPPLLPRLLGDVLAHEIAHMLEGVNRHSEEGLMKARWSRDDYQQMFRGLMQFTPEDVELIRAGALSHR